MGNIIKKCNCNLCSANYCRAKNNNINDYIDKDLYILEKNSILYNKFDIFDNKIDNNIKNLFDLFFVELNDNNNSIYDEYIISDNKNIIYKYITNKKLSLFVYNIKNILVPSFEKCIDTFINKGFDGIVYIDDNNKIISVKLCNYQDNLTHID